MTSRDTTGSLDAEDAFQIVPTAGLWPPPGGAWIAAGAVVLLYAAHWFYGALVSDTALVLNIGAAILVLCALAMPAMRADIGRLRGLLAPGVAFSLVILVCIWSLTPWVPGGPHPVWSYTGMGPGASTIDRSATIVETIKLLGLACLFLAGAVAGARDDRARAALQLTILAGVIFGVWSLTSTLSNAADPNSGHRLEAHFLNANTAGGFFAVLLMIGCAEFDRTVRSRRPSDRLIRTLLIAAANILFAICLLDSASRGAVLAFAGGATLYAVLRILTGKLKLTRALIAGITAIIGLSALTAATGERLIDRTFHTHEASIVRTEIWRNHWQAFLDSPLLGYGLGTAESVNKTLLNVSNYDALWNIRAILNVYLQWLEEAGVLGAAPMFACIGLIIASTARGTFRRSRMTGCLAGLLAVDAIILIHGATDFGLEVPSIAAFWAWLLGLQFSLAQGSSRR